MAIGNQDFESKRILVVGSMGHPKGVKCSSWDDIEAIPNLADYDVAIFDMTSISLESFGRIHNIRNISQERMNALIESGGEFFIIGPTSFIRNGKEIFIDGYHWFGHKKIMNEESGTTIKDVAPKFKRYFKAVDEWYFTILIPSITIAIAKNRYNLAIGIQSIGENRGKFFILPKPTLTTVKEGINIILEDFCGLALKADEPEWAKQIAVPGIEIIDKKIENMDNKIKKLKEQKQREKNSKERIRRFTKLLYAEGDELEQIVRETFRELEAEVHDPTEPGKDDGRVISKYGKGVLEIKKKSKSASKENVRQLDEWVGNCLSDGEEHKGILVLNHYGDKPIGERKEAFPDNVEKYAKIVRKQPFCLLTTLQLFNAFCAFKEKKLKAEEILRIIFKADGKCEL